MTLNDGTYSLEVGMLQSFLAEKFDENTLISNKYDSMTHSRLLSYLQFPDIVSSVQISEEISGIQITIDSLTKPVSYFFNVINNIDSVAMVQKASFTKAEEMEDMSNVLLTLKDYSYNKGWKLIYRINSANKFIVTLSPISFENILPRKDIISMVNQAGYDFINDYCITYITVGEQKMPQSISRTTTRMRATALPTKKVGDSYVTVTNTIDAGELIKLLYNKSIDLTSPMTAIYDGTDWKIDGVSVTTEVNKMVKDKVNGHEIQILIFPTKKRLYLVSDLEASKYYAITHSNDTTAAIKIAFSSEDVTINGIKSGNQYNLIGSIFDFPVIYADEIKLVKTNPVGNLSPKTMLIEVETPVYSEKYGYQVPSRVLYGDVNFDGVVDDKDMDIINEYSTDISLYSNAQRIVMKHREGHRTLDYTSIQNIVEDDITDIQALKGKKEEAFIAAPIEPKEALLYVGQVSDFIEYFSTAQTTEQTETNIKETFDGMNFASEPFLVHNKFLDYLLDSAIHKYSEEERIKMIYDLAGYNKVFNGYDLNLKETIANLQKNNTMPFCTGYVDVDTMYMLKEGQ